MGVEISTVITQELHVHVRTLEAVEEKKAANIKSDHVTRGQTITSC